MSSQMHLNTEQSKINNSNGKVKVTDLLSRINEEKKIEKHRFYNVVTMVAQGDFGRANLLGKAVERPAAQPRA